MSPVDDPRAPPAVLSGVETPDLVSSGKNGDAFASADALFFLAGSIARGLAAAHSPAHDRQQTLDPTCSGGLDLPRALVAICSRA
jgi:hypothetical protein